MSNIQDAKLKYPAAEINALLDKVKAGPGGGPMAEDIIYADLVRLCRDGNLKPGTWYRLVDYVTETLQTNTRSAGNMFDILVLALDEHTLCEECRAIARKGDGYFADADLAAWKVYYTTDNNRRNWGVSPDAAKKPEQWACAWGVLDSNASPKGSLGYTTVEVDGRTLYLYRPAEPTAHLDGVEFYRDVVLASIYSPYGLVFEADSLPYYDDNMGEYIYPREVRVKTAAGEQIATFSYDYDGNYYDDVDGMMDYCICFSEEATEVNGVYHLTPSEGIDSWWQGLKGGVVEIKGREVLTAPLSSVYYAFDQVLPQSSVQPTPLVYSTETRQVYQSDDWQDAVTFTRGSNGGTGVIYRLIDEFGNDLPFDFKNIQHLWEGSWYYTFGAADGSIGGRAAGNKISGADMRDIPVYIFTSTAVDNRIAGLPSEGCYFTGECRRNNLDFNSVTRITASGTFRGNTIRGTLGTLTTAKIMNDCEISSLGSSTAIESNADLLMCRIDIQPRNSMPLVINAGRLQFVTIVGAGYITIADANGNGKYLTMSTINTGMNGSTVYLLESRTTSLANRLEGLQVDILNSGTAEKRVDTSAIPLNATYKTCIGTNAAGEVKIWCAADKA